jgi:Ser-tRNA(Ala) deacylase AlaX
MEKIYRYEREPYRRELEVEVLEVGELEGRPFAVLDDTILYPEGGGQPSDRGRLGQAEVVEVQKTDDQLRHYLASPVATGPATLELDWERRYDHMQQHTAQHLLSSISLARFGWNTRSFHIGSENSDIELDIEPPAAHDLEALEEEVAAAVVAAHPITCRRVTREEYDKLDVRSRGLPAGHSGDIRLVEIEGVDLNTCGGTHLASTAEVETVKILRAEPLRGGCRLYWVAGKRVRRRLGRHEARNAELRSLFDTGDEELAPAAALKLEQLGLARRRVRELESELAGAVVDALLARGEPVVEAHFQAADGGFLHRTASELVERGGRCVALLTASGEKGDFFTVAVGKDSPVELAEVGPRVAELLSGRGGGSGQIFQGKAGSLAGRTAALALLRDEVGERD